MDVNTILKMTVESLKMKLKELELSTRGNKAELRDRLLGHLKFIDDEDEEDDFSSDFQDGELEMSKFTLKDVKDNLNEFSGKDYPKIGDWIRDFEETARTVKWNGLQKYVYAKQLLTGAAKSFVRSQIEINDWDSLKHELMEEFEESVASIDVHMLLKKRRKRNDETLREYLYAIMEMGKPIKLDEQSLLKYFADGIVDSKVNKVMLYQANNLSELKKAIKVYETMSNLDHEQGSKQDKKNLRAQKSTESHKNCFKCGDSTHIAKNCPSKEVKCFKCNKFGHKSFECGKEQEKQRVVKMSSMVENSLGVGSPVFKVLTLNGYNIEALVDLGCDLNLMRYDTLMKVGDFDLSSEHLVVRGVKDSSFNTIGSFEVKTVVDNQLCTIRFHVVRERDLEFAAVIGNEMLRHINMLAKEKEVIFLPKDETNQVQGKDHDLTQVFHSLCMSVQVEEENKSIDIDVKHLENKYETRVRELVENYKPQRVVESPVEMKIILTDEIPVHQTARRIPSTDKEIVEKQVDEWLKENIVQPSNSQYASPIVLVKKKDGGKRLCCDYRKINEKIMRDNFPVAVMDDVLEQLSGADIFITLDLRNGYFHVPVAIDSRKYTAFVTHHGQFEFMFVPFGISNSPAVFARFIHAIFYDLVMKKVLVVYVDDIIIYADNIEECIQKFEVVLKRAADHGLKFKWTKCQFLRKQVEFLGYNIQKSTISPSESKVNAVKNYPIPQNKQALQRFLGLTSYFRRFIENHAQIARPLTNMLKKDAKFCIDEEALMSFEELKLALINAPALQLYDPSAITEVHTDASKYGYGGILMQRNKEDQAFHPVQFMSRKTTPQEEKYHSYELEVLAIIEALKKWRVYLVGIRFKIITDCNAFTMTMKKKDIPVRVSRWAMFLQDYNYEIEHRSGSRMKHVDALSRITCLILQSTLKHRLKTAQMNDDWLKGIRQILSKEEYHDYYIKHDIIYKDPVKELIVVPGILEKEIIMIAHRQGHLSATRTKEYVEKNFYIPQLGQKVASVVGSCIECMVIDSKRGKKEGYLNTISKESGPLDTYHIDHVGPLETTPKAYNYILVVVDGFTKFVWLYPTKGTDAISIVDRLNKQAAVFGNPRRIITDRGSGFTGNVFKEYCMKEGIQHLLIATGVPRGNGQVERMHKVVVPLISKLCQENSKMWYKQVEKVQQLINNCPPRSTQYSPFKLLTGLDMRVSDGIEFREILEDEMIKELDNDREEIRSQARENILKIQAENRRTFNKNRKAEIKFQIDDLVAIQRTQFATGMKLRPKFLGPYRVTEVLPHGRYRVEKVGDTEGPNNTISVSEYMKRWCT